MERFFGREPVRLLKEKSTVCRFVRLANEDGIGPVRLFCDRILFEQFIDKKLWNVLEFTQEIQANYYRNKNPNFCATWK